MIYLLTCVCCLIFLSADYNLARCVEVQGKLGNDARYPVEKVDASKQDQIEVLAK